MPRPRRTVIAFRHGRIPFHDDIVRNSYRLGICICWLTMLVGCGAPVPPPPTAEEIEKTPTLAAPKGDDASHHESLPK
jgi:hypothetical protein